MIIAGLDFLRSLAEAPETGVNAGLALVNAARAAASPAIAAAPLVRVCTELDVDTLAQLVLDEALVADGPVLAITQASDAELPAAADALLGIPGVVYALTAARLDDGQAAPSQLMRDAGDTLRAASRAVTLPFTQVIGARRVLRRGAMTFAQPARLLYAARQAERGGQVTARTLLVHLAADDPFLAGGPA